MNNSVSSEQENNCNEEFVSVEITEANFYDADELAAAKSQLAEQMEKQGASRLVRPKISKLRLLLNVSVPLIVSAGIFLALYFSLPAYELTIALSVSLGGLGLYVLIRTRAILIWCIKLYQATAPAHVRERCVFEPTCSNYAIEALEKLGVIRGIPKIISRLRRCHFPNGGYDPLIKEESADSE